MFSHDETDNFLINLHKKKENFLSSAKEFSKLVNMVLLVHRQPPPTINWVANVSGTLFFAIKTLKNEILAWHLKDKYTFLREINDPSYVTKTLDTICDLIIKKPDLSALAYQELSLSSKETFKAALTYITHQRSGWWKEYYQKIMEFCALPIERSVVATQPGNQGFQLLNNNPSFFERPLERKDPKDSALITKDDCLLVRIWLPNKKAGVRISFEAQQYSRTGSLFLTPVRQMHDGFQRTYFNDYLSFANNPNDKNQDYDDIFDYYKFYQKMLMTTFLTTGMDEFIANVLLKMIADYAEPDPFEKVKTLIALDTELQGSPPDHTFRLTEMNAEKIWERALEYVYPEQSQIHQHILITKKIETDVLDEVLYLFKRATNYNYEVEKKLQCIYSLKENETKLQKLIGVLSEMSAPEPKVSRLTQSP